MCFVLQPCSMNSTASQSRSSGCVGGSPFTPKSAGAANADALGRCGDRCHDDLGRGADNGRVVVVFGHPEALVAQCFAVARERHGIADRLIVGAAGNGDRLVENGKTHDARNLGDRDADVLLGYAPAGNIPRERLR